MPNKQTMAETINELEKTRQHLHSLVDDNPKLLLNKEIYEVSAKLDKLIVSVMRKETI